MKLIISSSELLKGIMAVSKAIPAKSSLPILENFLFDVKDNTLVITASDSELTLRTRLTVESSSGDGRIAVPARHMQDLLKEIPDQPITIQTIKENYFECSWMGGVSTLPFFSADEYPQITTTEEGAVTVKFPAQVLLDGISSTIYATDDDEMRPVMNGILFDMTPAGTTLVASDSRKLICFSTTEVKTDEQSNFILHKKPAAVLRSIIGKDTEEVTVTYDGKNAVFAFDETIAVCRLIVGRYPKYRDVIPQNNSNVLKIDRQQLLNCVRRVSVCANKASNHIKFDLQSNSLTVSAQDLGFSIAAHEKSACQYDGEDLHIGFKSTFLVDILSNLSCSEVTVKFSDARRAALLLPSDDGDQTEKICAILMPIQI